MSRIGKKQIQIPDGVKVNIDTEHMTVEGPKAKLTRKVPPKVNIEVDDSVICVKRTHNSKESDAMQGLTRSLLAGMVEGVTKGFKKNLEIVGVGFRAKVNGNKLDLNVGYSHPINYNIPEGINIKVTENTKIEVEGADKQLVGQVAAIIRRYRKPEPYKGKGIRYAGERIAIKEGKSV
ncbi:MAG: 50S ribosomal protein L6 [Victivallales bacterium]|nr:50S ribosomal protein L6 [Victivallales bacterium]MCF7889200.1 50S ribosomal protein L6 [Victivallales bacterium]